MTIQKVSSPLYEVSYQRSGKVYANQDALFANWTPDTLDKSLHQEDQKVGVIYTKLRNHSVGEAIKDAVSDVGPGLMVMLPLLTAVGGLIGVGAEMAGHAGAALVGGLSGAGLAAGLLGWAGVSEYRDFRSNVGEKSCEFSGYAYRERADQKEVKLIRGWDLASRRDSEGYIVGGAAPTAHGYCEIRSLGKMAG